MKKLATILFIVLSHTVFAQFDSLKITLPLDTLTRLANKLDSIEALARGRMDSVTQYYDQVNNKIQQLSTRYQQKVDSLGHLKLPTGKYILKIDSLASVLADTKEKVESKMHSIKQKATEKINSFPFPPELRSKVSQLTGSLDKYSLSSLSSKINSPIDLKSLDTSIDQIVPSANLKDISSLPTVNTLPDVTKNLGSVSDLTKGISEQTNSLQQGASQATQDIAQVNNLDKLAESQVTKMDAVKDFTMEAGNLPTLMTSEDEAKKMALDQAKQVAIDHFAGKEEVLKSAMDKVSKYKQKYSSISSLSEIGKRPPNPMKGKPFIERIVPGIQFQIFKKQENFLTDFNLYAGYRINGRLTMGIGWNQRVAFNTDRNVFNPNARIFGPRAFGEFKLGRGFSPRLEVEAMNTLVPPFGAPKNVDEQGREWVVSAMVGIKKEYRFYKNIKGTTTIMLNTFHPHNKNLYPDIVNARFGFEFPVSKKKR